MSTSEKSVQANGSKVSAAIVAGIETPSISAAEAAVRVSAFRNALAAVGKASSTAAFLTKGCGDNTLRYGKGQNEGLPIPIHLAATASKEYRVSPYPEMMKLVGAAFASFAEVATCEVCVIEWKRIQAERVAKGLAATPAVVVKATELGSIAGIVTKYLAQYEAYRVAVEVSRLAANGSKPVAVVKADEDLGDF